VGDGLLRLVSRYADMKECGDPSSTQIPSHWHIAPLSAIARQKSIIGLADRELLSVYLDKGVVRFAEVEEKRTNVTSEDLSKYQAVDPGDFVLNNQQAWRGSVGVSSLSGIVSPAYIVLSLSPRIDAGYANLLFRARFMVDQYLVCSRGVGTIQRNLYWPSLKRAATLLPPLCEQRAIVRFLDHAERKIRKYIRAKQGLIKVLEEQKQAIIHRAVTRGIDPNVRLKPSGVEWLGDVPEHWDIWQIGHFCAVGNGSTPSRSNSVYWSGGTYPWLNSSSVHAGTISSASQFVTAKALQECHLPRVPSGSVLVAITGQGKTRGTAAVLAVEATINQHIAFISPRQGNSIAMVEFLRMCLVGAYRELRRISDDSGSTKGALTCEDLRHFRIAIPKQEEQLGIVRYLESSNHGCEAAIRHAIREIGMLVEYRNRLIADAVTGKIDVRQSAVLITDEVEESLPEDVAEPMDVEDVVLDEVDALIEEADV
jgi:type I restriction enzyme, S subunit